MAKSKQKSLIGGWASLVGVVLAIVLGLFGTLSPAMVYVLVVIGLIVGFLNIAEEETSPFLLAGTVLIIASSLGSDILGVISELGAVLNALLAIFVPATVVVAIRHVFRLARH